MLEQRSRHEFSRKRNVFVNISWHHYRIKKILLNIKYLENKIQKLKSAMHSFMNTVMKEYLFEYSSKNKLMIKCRDGI